MFNDFSKFKKELLEDCKACNACFKDCYAYHKTNFRIMKHLKDFFEHQEYVSEFKNFIDSCLYCKVHESACINGIDLTLLISAIKSDLRKLDPKYTWKPQNTLKIVSRFLSSENFYRFWRNFNYKLIPKEIRLRYEKYRRSQKREIVFFSGCGIQLLENQYYLLLQILEKLDVDFGLIDGSYLKPVCCGAVHCELGNFESGLFLLKNLINEIKRFKTKKVMVYCATCYFGLKTIAPQLIENYDLEIIHATEYIAEILKDQLEVKKKELIKPRKQKYTITIHDSCHLAHGSNGNTSGIRDLISLLPNVKISEMRHNKNRSLCDLYYILMALRNPFTFLFRRNKIYIINEAIDTNADVLCSLCPGCHALLSIFGSDIFSLLGKKKTAIPVKNWVSILGDYLGLRMKDMLDYRFKHVFAIPYKESGMWYIWQAIKALMRGYFGKKEPKPLEKKIKKYRKTRKE
ncbi:MAG: (Fe-S)-binding protein [Promethearchaeota archaeon]